MKLYKLIAPLPPQTESIAVLRTSDNCSIPFNEANVDYVSYLDWLSEGNTPEPADELPKE